MSVNSESVPCRGPDAHFVCQDLGATAIVKEFGIGRESVIGCCKSLILVAASWCPGG